MGGRVFRGLRDEFFQRCDELLEAREDIRGRVLSLYTFLMIGSTPVGGAFTGFVADTLDVRVALLINASICLFGLLCSVIYLRRATR